MGRRAAGAAGSAAARAAASPTARRAAWLGLLAGAVGAGIAAGSAVEHRRVRAQRQRPDPRAAELSDRAAGRSFTVAADDGVALAVDEVGDPAAPLTVVFAHGYCCTMDCWHFQRRDLADLGRLVFWDQRSHGRSGRADAGSCTIDQLGADLYRVLAERVPTGPVVLVGHSMGGMTIMALADRHPELFGDRVVGCALLSTSAGKLAALTFGLPAGVGWLTRRLMPGVTLGVNRMPALVERARGSAGGSDVAYALTQRIAFGTRTVPPSVVDLMERMVAGTPSSVITAFLPAFLDHDKLAALDVLRPVPTLVLVGENDVITPPEHSKAMADALPDADAVTVPGAGHMVILEAPDEVNGHLRALVGRVAGR